MKKTSVNWGILSCARIADSSLIPGIKASSNSKLHAIAGKTPDRLKAFAQKHQPAKTYDTYEAMLTDPDVDAVYIPLPNSLHLEWVLKAARCKKHILCEKPLGLNPGEVREMTAAARENGVILMEAFAYRHNPLTFKLKELIDSDVIGKLHYIEADFTAYVHDRNDIRMYKELGGGAAYDLGCYTTSVMRYLAGREPVSILADGEVNRERGVDESGCGVFDFGEGLKGIFHFSFNCEFKCGYRLIGEKGLIEVPLGFNQDGRLPYTIRTSRSSETFTLISPHNYMLEAEQLARCILDGETPLVTLEDSYANAVCIEKMMAEIFSRSR